MQCYSVSLPCKKYYSCFASSSLEKLNNILCKELLDEKISMVHTKPTQIQALEAFPKPDGAACHLLTVAEEKISQ